MAYPATNRFNYWGQLGILAGLTGAGLIVGQLVAIVPLLSKISFKGVSGNSDLMDKLFVPANAGVLRVVQFITTLFLFFIPTLIYARICHKKSFTHLGLKQPVTIQQAVVVILIMVATLPLVGILSDFTASLPFPKTTMDHFKAVEEAYGKQINIIGRMDNFGDYLLSLFMLAILPGLFEETFFRGGVQNLLSRWLKMPLLSIILTAVIFSAAHGSYLGFLSRVALGFVLGWIYNRTGNLWLNVIFHAIYNGTAVTALYLSKLNHPNIDLSKADDMQLPLWTGLISLIAIPLLFIAFEKVSRYQIKDPGKEELIPLENPNQPSWLNQSAENKSL